MTFSVTAAAAGCCIAPALYVLGARPLAAKGVRVVFSRWPLATAFAATVGLAGCMASAGAVFGVCAAGAAAAIDFATGYIPDSLTAPGLGVAAAFALCTGNFADAAAGAALAGGALGAIYAVSRGRAIGCGDVKLALAAGMAFGLHAAARLLQCTFIAGGAVAAVLLIAGIARRGTTLPFAPFLFAGIAATVVAQ